jgi:hypothetical protein
MNMSPLQIAELNVIPMSSMNFKFPECECGRNDVHISIEYCRVDNEPEKVHCWVWAQVGDAFIRGLVDQYTAPHSNNTNEQLQYIVSVLNNSVRFKSSLPAYIASVLTLDPEAAQ